MLLPIVYTCVTRSSFERLHILVTLGLIVLKELLSGVIMDISIQRSRVDALMP